MNPTSPTARRPDLDAPSLSETDAAAVLERLASGTPLDPAVVG